jgi:hypothetical protein
MIFVFLGYDNTTTRKEIRFDGSFVFLFAHNTVDGARNRRRQRFEDGTPAVLPLLSERFFDVESACGIE